MSEASELRDPWLIAVWPGMGNVALAAGGYLVAQLEAQLVNQLPPRDSFDLKHIEVKGGIARPGQMPRSMVFEWRDPNATRDLVIFIGEAQPETGGYAFCHRLIDYARSRGVTRVVTFAALATQLHPSNDPRVFAVATAEPVIRELEPHGVEVLEEGQISGLNGVLLAAGLEQGLPGACLLGELPFFAVGVPNPKASLAVLQVFTSWMGITIDLAELQRQTVAMERGLLELLEKMKAAATEESEGSGEFALEIEEPAATEDEKGPPAPPLDETARRRIETLFDEARVDRSRAVRLKQELDRLGVFREYEDRFLDLFKRAE
ncbi:MAG: PAC2 family protein [Phycisphaerae bacterium]|nr:PAC2 family protein [Phycisphaerae bacterium]